MSYKNVEGTTGESFGIGVEGVLLKNNLDKSLYIRDESDSFYVDLRSNSSLEARFIEATRSTLVASDFQLFRVEVYDIRGTLDIETDGVLAII